MLCGFLQRHQSLFEQAQMAQYMMALSASAMHAAAPIFLDTDLR
jgi:hypothetical protein